MTHCLTCKCDKPTKYHLRSGHVSALAKLRHAVFHYQRNRIHIRKEMFATGSPFDLTFDELTNFSYLRFFGLAVHADEENRKSGYWLITARGGQFLRGEIAIQDTTIARAGHPIAHEGKAVWVRDFRSKIPAFWEDPARPVEPRTAQLFS